LARQAAWRWQAWAERRLQLVAAEPPPPAEVPLALAKVPLARAKVLLVAAR
jgi:hypothetical protein